jgi:hypothetical protein
MIKLGQDAYLGNSLNEFEHGSFRMKNFVTGAKNRKNLLTYSGHIFDSIIIKLCQDAYLDNSSNEFEHGSSRIKN